MIKTHRFRGKPYKIIWDGDTGDAKGTEEYPNKNHPEIEIDSSQVGLSFLNTVIHESLHACQWDLSEEAICETANDISRLMWHMFKDKEITCRVLGKDK